MRSINRKLMIFSRSNVIWEKIPAGRIAVILLFILFISTERATPQNGTWRDPIPGSGASVIHGPGWYASHADGGNTDYSPTEGPRRITLAWERKFRATINLGPTNNAKGVVYVTTSGQGCHLHALDNKTGKTLWCSDEVNEFAVASSALLDSQDRLFIADNEAMHAFDSSGKIIWETPIEGFPFSAQFTQSGHLIFITCIGKIYVLDRDTGAEVLPPYELAPGTKYDRGMDVRACMRGTQDCPCANTLAFDETSGNFYFTFWTPGSPQAALVAMKYSESPRPAITPLWTNNSLPGGSATSPDISFDRSKIYVNDNAGGLHALNAQTGDMIWSFDIGYEPGGSQSTSPEGFILPAGGGNGLLMCIADRGSYAELLWKSDSLLNRGVATQAAGALAYATVKSGPLQNDLVVIDVRSGTEIDRERLPGKTLFSVGTTIGPDGFVYVPTFNGYLFAFRPEEPETK